MHNKLFLHVGLDKFNELVEEDIPLLTLLLSVLLDKEVEKTDDIGLFKLEAKLVRTLAKQELDECVLTDDQVLPSVLLVDHRRKIWHHALCKCLDLQILWKPLYDLHQNLINFLQQNVLL